LPEPFTIERALPMMDEAGVDRVVIVPPGLNDRNRLGQRFLSSNHIRRLRRACRTKYG
jgi:hypothetical protein